MKDSKFYSWCIRNNIAFKLLAFFLAFMLWYYVAGQNDPIINKDFTIPVEADGLSSETVLVSPLPEIKVSTRGVRSVLRNTRGEDIRAYVQIAEQVAGETLLPVQIEAPFGVEVIHMSQEWVKVSLDMVTEKQVPIRVLVHGDAAPGFAYSNPVADPGQVTVKGPGRILDEILDVQAVIDIGEAKEDIKEEVNLRLGKNYGEQVTIHPGSVQVFVPVTTSGPVKTVNIIADLQGEPADGFVISSHDTVPGSLKVTGSESVISGLREIRTTPVDIGGAQEDITKDVELILPRGVILLEQGKVKVTVVIEPIAEEEQIPIE